MSNIDDSVKATQDAEAALEARVTAHEQNDAATAAALQQQIDDLKAGNGDANAIANLQALVDHMNNFDPENPTPPPTPTDTGTGTATNTSNTSGQTF
jgi:hypothetical protein